MVNMMSTTSMMDQIIADTRMQIKQTQGGIDYCDQALASDLEPWERKEYEKVKANYVAELPRIQDHLNWLLAQ